MDNNQIVLSSLAMDLKRVALGYHRGSSKMANSFFKEALKRKDEIDINGLPQYLRDLLNKLPDLVSSHDKQKIAEDALMFSTLFQNSIFKAGIYSK